MIDLKPQPKQVLDFCRRYAADMDPRSEFIQNVLKNIGAAQSLFIQTRTERGIDVNLQPFKKYKEAYLAWKAKYGKGRTGNVNLNLEGILMSSMGSQVLKSGEVIIGAGLALGQSDSHAYLSRIHDQGRGKMPKREHLGFAKSDIKSHLEFWEDENSKRMQRYADK